MSTHRVHQPFPQSAQQLSVALVRMTAARDAYREAYRLAVAQLHAVTRERDQLRRQTNEQERAA